jgi:uncharacterized protein (DUF2384 family)
MDVSVISPAVWNRILLLFGNEQKANSWLHTKLSELHEQTPEEILNQDHDSEAVNTILDRIEYGVFG